MLQRFDWAIALGVTFASFGCSGPVPATPAAGLQLSIAQAVSCPVDANTQDDIGNPPPNSTGQGKGNPVYNGEAGTKVNCEVRFDGTTGAIYASISSQSPRVSFTVQQGFVTSQGGTGQISISSLALGSAVGSPDATPCTLTVVETAGNVAQIKPGAVWARFDCKRLESPPSTTCQASGEFLLENCKH